MTNLQFQIILADGAGGAKEYLLKELLPLGFGPENLHKAVGKLTEQKIHGNRLKL